MKTSKETARRTIRTRYYFKGNLTATNASSDPNQAVANAVRHMQANHYGANSAEVYDEVSGLLHAQITRTLAGDKVTISYQRDPSKFEARLALGAILFPFPNKGRIKVVQNT